MAQSKGASADADRAPHERSRVSPSPPSRVSVPSAAADAATKPFSVYGMPVTGRHIANAIDRLANLPEQFIAMDLVSTVLQGATFHQKQEALNRLFQRWRKLGLAEFRRGRWQLTKGAWDTLQASAIEARRAATENTGAVADESAVAKPDTQHEDTP